MARRGRIVAGLAGALALGLVALLLAGALTRTRQVETLGVLPIYPVAPLVRGQQTCEHDVALADPLEGVRVHVGTFGKPGPPIGVTIRSSSGSVLASGRAPGGWHDNGTPRDVTVGRVDTQVPVTVCVRNLGATKAWVFGDSFGQSVSDNIGGPRPTIATSYATLEGTRIGDKDLAIEFTTPDARSLLERVPAMFRHAALFRPPLVGAWTFWVLLVLLVVGAPLLLLRAALRAADEDGDEEEPEAPAPPVASASPPARERVPASSSR